MKQEEEVNKVTYQLSITNYSDKSIQRGPAYFRSFELDFDSLITKESDYIFEK